ncbi:MAG: hypothetical protein NTU99_07315, partial [Pseudanabaena sp. LacPavin_0818_WC45_MAG_42_6]|nr:hypothetical protein [Pseudanabaena sp. LacPavin_0818_WC45_MAG_42_6]
GRYIVLKVIIYLLNLFALFTFGIFIAFPISLICGSIDTLLFLLPMLWQIFWRVGMGLLLLTPIALFLKAL